VDVTFTVRNTGDVAGTEIAQVYLGKTQVPAHIQMAEKQLCGFARLEDLQPGEQRTVTITIPQRSLCYWDPAQPLTTRPDGTRDKWVTATGERTVYVGPASDQLPLQTQILV
jgi:beta-glucosidase